MAQAAQKRCSDRAYHVDRNDAQDRWDVTDDEGQVIGHCHDQGAAIDLAIREAQHAHSRGDDVIVCVEQSDGHYALAWAPQRAG
jgi:hypothetical protein